MDMSEIVKLVNEKLRQGLSTAQIEKEMKLGKDTLRKRLNRADYRYDKESNQYKLTSNTDITKSVVTQSNIYVTDDSNTLITPSVVTHDIENITLKKVELTEDEIKILKVIAGNYKKANSDYQFNGEVVTRSVRTYKNVLEQFSSYCKENNLSQKDSIAIALMDFIAK